MTNDFEGNAIADSGGERLINLETITNGNSVRPPKIVLYGVPGVGKTTWATSAPKPIVLPIEDGLGSIKVPHFPVLKSWREVETALHSLAVADKLTYKTLIIDSLDALETLVWKMVETESGKRVEDHGFGKGYLLASEIWNRTLGFLDRLVELHGLSIVLIAHSDIKAFNSPETDPYDRYVLRVHKRARDIICDWADTVLFANYKVYTTTNDGGFTKITRGVGNGERVMYTSERPAWTAKNRYGLPDELPLSWEAFKAALTTKPKN